MPITTPAYFGAMSIWFTLNPPRAKPNAPKVSVVAAIPGSVSEAMGISINATAELVRPERKSDGYRTRIDPCTCKNVEGQSSERKGGFWRVKDEGLRSM
eukprot:scaffold73687_cov14-Tisochrysis_lutea.AAC.1